MSTKLHEAKPFVSVIIPHHNDWERLEKCIKALLDQTYPKKNFEIIVVDNNSTIDGTEMRQRYPTVRWLAETKKGSYAARNCGVKSASGDILAFTDSDCVPNPDWIEQGVEFQLREPDCGLIGGKVELFFDNPESPNATDLYESVFSFHQEAYIEHKHFAVTANVFIRKQLLEKVGLFNSQLLSGGDAELGQRLYSQNYTLKYCDSAAVKHPTRSDLEDFLEKHIRTDLNYIKRLMKERQHLRVAGEIFFFPLAIGWFSKMFWEKTRSFSLSLRLSGLLLITYLIFRKTFARFKYAVVNYSR